MRSGRRSPDGRAEGAQGDGTILVRFIHFPVETLGPGRRVGVWLQGCSIRCPGCVSPENQPFDEARAMPVERAAERILAWGCDRATISGGEPFDQADALLALLRRIGRIPDILVYTGYEKERVLRERPEAAGLLAALVDGAFRLGLPTEAVWKGSENQTLTVLRGEFAERYGAWAAERKGRLQLARDGGEVRLLGIPRQEDVPALLRKLKESGVMEDEDQSL